MHGRGIRYRLQSHVPALGRMAANAFDLAAWRQATRLTSFGVELYVSRGAVTVSLRHIAPDGQETEYARLDRIEPGSAFSPPIMTAELEGALLPVVETADPEAAFDIYFGTNEDPPNPMARIAYLLDNRDRDLDRASAAFRGYLDDPAQQDARQIAHLVAVNAGSVAETAPDPAITLLANDRTGADAFGRGLYELCYGALAVEGFTHACLLPEGLPPHPEMFARTAAFLRFLRPDFHVCAPLYSADNAPSPDLPGPRCLGFGDAPATGLLDEPGRLEGGQEPTDIAAFLAAGRGRGQAGLPWCCLDLSHVYRAGLPIPFPSRAGWSGYAARLQRSGAHLFVPFSFWARQDQAGTPPTAAHKGWAARALQGVLDDPDALRAGFETALQDRPEARAALKAEMAAFLAGPEALLAQPQAQTPQSPPRRGLLSRWRTALSAGPDDLAEAIAAYRAAGAWLTTAAYWAQMAGNRPPSGPVLPDPDRARAAAQQQSLLAAQHLKVNMQARRQQADAQAHRRDLEARLQRTGLLDEARVQADLDRANRVALSLLRNRHRGQRAVIVGNGPSLRMEDLTRLRNAVTFASNKIYLAYDQTPWRPTYYSVEDHLVILNNRERIEQLTGSIKIFPANVRDFGFHAADTVFVPFHPPHSFDDPLSDPEFPDFSEDLSHGICWGSTIVYSQIQMALYMGCSEIVLIGLDHAYELPETRSGRRFRYEGERNHFHPEYRAPGEWWHQPNLEVLEVSYARARDRCAAHGVRVLNASRRTKLDIFERADFDSLFPPETESP